MKLVIISDTHGHRPGLPDGDVLIHCGDFSTFGTTSELAKFNKWFSSQPHKHKIIVPGNHDGAVMALGYILTESGNILLIDNMVTIDGVSFYGSPWTPTFMNWYFMKDRGPAIAERWARIPDNLDVLITHGPPMGVLDWSIYSKEHVGCADLLRRVLEIKPKIHCFGHIHAEYGEFTNFGTTFINAAQVSESYKLINNPVEKESNFNMRCYDGCPDSELQALIDAKIKARKEIESLGYTVTYFPMEDKWMAFKNYLPATKFHNSIIEIASILKKEI